MARYAPTSQRLLSTLMQTSKFYAARPSLTSPILFRFYSEAAEPTQPRPSGFSISFADGSLDDIIRKRKEAVVEKSASEVDVEDGDGVHVDSKPAKAKPARVNSKRKSAKPAQANGTAAKITAPKEISKRKTGRLAQAKGAPIKVSPANDNSELKLSTRAAPTTATATEEPHSAVEGEPEASQPALPPQAKKAPRSEPIVSSPSPRPQPKKEHWQIQKAALKEKFGNEGWNPRKKLSPDTIEGIRALHAQYPDRYTTPVLAEQFQVSKEAVRRILKSKWSSNLDPEKQAERRERWASRHDRIWDQKAAIGLRPERTVSREPENPDAFEEELRAKEMLAAHR